MNGSGASTTHDQRVALSIDSARELVNVFLDDFMQKQILAASDQSKEYGRLWTTIQQVVSGGGKRLRPYLLLQAYAMYDSGTYQTVIPIAAAQELLHISMLMHDDIIDRDYERHGKPNIAGHYKTIYADLVPKDDLDHYSTSAALLAGDLLISSAYNIINSSELNSQQRTTAAEILHNSVFTVVGGELSDVESTFDTGEAIDPLHIAHYKTAIYSFVNPLVCGARLTGITEADIQPLTDFGVHCGIAFQLTDDLLGVFGDEEKTGKSTLSDLQEGKGTYLIQQTKASLRKEDSEQFMQLFGKRDLTHAEADELKKIIVRSGAKQATTDKIIDHVANAKAALSQIQKTGRSTDQLNMLLTKLTARQS